MTTGILGMGWVTPWGREISAIWKTRQNFPTVETTPLEGSATWPVLRVPAAVTADVARLPRLRRSSVISHFAVAAAQDAVAMAGLTAGQLARCALVFVTSDGGVVYTRRFYGDVVSDGPGAGSPALFPETVYNAPASHIAAALGLAGEVLTLVGDCAAGLAGVQTATELLATPEVDYCLVVAAQELDWISAEAYGRWRLIRGDKTSATAYFAEGAAALVLGRGAGRSRVGYFHPGLSYLTTREAQNRMQMLLAAVPDHLSPEIIVSSLSGSSFDRVEREACQKHFPQAETVAPKFFLGDTMAVSTLQQLIVADLILHDRPLDRALVPATGVNGQFSALILTRESASVETAAT